MNGNVRVIPLIYYNLVVKKSRRPWGRRGVPLRVIQLLRRRYVPTNNAYTSHRGYICDIQLCRVFFPQARKNTRFKF